MATTTFGTAHHPFRATLPLRVLRQLPQYEPEVLAKMAEAAAREAAPDRLVEAPATGRPLFTLGDLRDFLMAYTACFVAATAWLA